MGHLAGNTRNLRTTMTRDWYTQRSSFRSGPWYCYCCCWAVYTLSQAAHLSRHASSTKYGENCHKQAFVTTCNVDVASCTIQFTIQFTREGVFTWEYLLVFFHKFLVMVCGLNTPTITHAAHLRSSLGTDIIRYQCRLVKVKMLRSAVRAEADCCDAPSTSR